ncbi:MAG: OmpA family protein [bacterium]
MSSHHARNQLYEATKLAEVDNASFWLVPYGNMMTILMIFFLVMYAFALQNKWKVKKITESIKESISSKRLLKEDLERLGLLGEFKNFIWNNQMDQFIEITADSRLIHIAMQSPVLFGSGSITLTDKGRKILDQIAMLIKSEVGDVRVAGYTDNAPVTSGVVQDNWELSGKRAYKVVHYFTKECGLIPIRFSVNGYGEYSPMVSNDSPENRALNRRIDISIIKKKKLWTE